MDKYNYLEIRNAKELYIRKIGNSEQETGNMKLLIKFFIYLNIKLLERPLVGGEWLPCDKHKPDRGLW